MLVCQHYPGFIVKTAAFKCGIRDLRELVFGGGESSFRLVLGRAVREDHGELFRQRVSHGELDPLVRLAVAVCADMYPDDLGGEFVRRGEEVFAEGSARREQQGGGSEDEQSDEGKTASFHAWMIA